MSNRDGRHAKRPSKLSHAKQGDKCPNCTPLKGKPRQAIRLDPEGHALPIKNGKGKGGTLKMCKCGCNTNWEERGWQNVHCPSCNWSNY